MVQREKGNSHRCIGRSRGGMTTKLHALVDAEGRPVMITFSEAQNSDCAQAPGLLDRPEKGSVLLAGKSYACPGRRSRNSDAIRAEAAAAGAFANIPPNRKRKRRPAFSALLYRYRNLVKRFFRKLNHARGIATRYDNGADNYLAVIKLFCVRIWLPSNEPTALSHSPKSGKIGHFETAENPSRSIV